MKPGPPKTPTALALLRGNPGRRALSPDEPTPPLAKDQPPPGLTNAALKIWEARVPGLVACALIAWVDVGHVARACRLEAKADQLLRRGLAHPLAGRRIGRPPSHPANGEKIEKPAAVDLRQSQELTTALTLFVAADQIWYRLGITPSERTRLRSRGPGGPADPLGKHLGARPPAPRMVAGKRATS